MATRKHLALILAAALMVAAAAPAVSAAAPVFSLAWSEYPSWSAFGVAHELKLIDGRRGAQGPIEKKWGVDIELKEADYDACLVMYGANNCDAVCITNMDALNPSLTRPSVAVLPTSTSHGADALIVPAAIADIKQLRGKKIYGLAKTVSEYCFVRNLEIIGEKETDYAFTNMDPAAAALNMQQGRKDFEAIVVWNPFVLETLNKRKDTRVLFDSTAIPGEIIDMVVVSQAALDKAGGPEFAAAAAEAFYAVARRLEDPAARDQTLIALGEKFSNLDLASMRKVVQQTRFYGTPQAGLKVLDSAETRAIMEKVLAFCASHEIVPRKPAIGYGDKAAAPGANLRFDPSFIALYQKKAK
jgi:NitT/TauT family transport system substrate-binding protein